MVPKVQLIDKGTDAAPRPQLTRQISGFQEKHLIHLHMGVCHAIAAAGGGGGAWSAITIMLQQAVITQQTRHGLLLAQRLRRWPNIKTACCFYWIGTRVQPALPTNEWESRPPLCTYRLNWE